MSLRLGIDFGTATTCVAVVRDASLIPEVVRIEPDFEFSESKVWVSPEATDPEIVESRSPHGRSPRAAFSAADDRFRAYWDQRIHAQDDSVRWSTWNEARRERSMLLSYFKPELADVVSHGQIRVVDSVVTEFNPLTQSSEVTFTYANRTIANPAPDTSDLVAATAAVIREAVRTAAQRFGERIELLLVGMPSYGTIGSQAEHTRARERRMQAIELAGIEREFGTKQFRAEVCGEAEAAGFSFEPAVDARDAYTLICDVGAGTTDLALVSYVRESNKRFRVDSLPLQRSYRLGGRNVNEAVARALRHHQAVEEAYRAMDPRAWQYLLDRDIEAIKRTMTDDETSVRLPFHLYASAAHNGQWHNPERDALRRSAFVDVGFNSPGMSEELTVIRSEWGKNVREFFKQAIDLVAPKPIATVELVGGGFRFTPIRTELENALWDCGLDSVPVSFRDAGNQAQTAVARGLARRAFEL